MTADQELYRRQWVLSALNQYEGRLTRYAARLLGDTEAARDVTQHAFLRLCDQDPEKIGDSIAAWLFTVCRNKAMDMIRANSRSTCLPENGNLHLARTDVDPAVDVEQADLHEVLLQLVHGLPEAQRESVDLWSRGFDYREIARVTSRSEGAVRVLVHRGLTALREHPRTRALLEGRRVM